MVETHKAFLDNWSNLVSIPYTSFKFLLPINASFKSEKEFSPRREGEEERKKKIVKKQAI